MDLIECDQMIEQLSATASDPTFRKSILPRACRAYAIRFHAAGCEQIGYLLTELAVSVESSIAAGTRSWKCLPQLLHDPGAGRVVRNIEMQNPPAAVFDDEEAIQDSEAQRRDREEIHGRDHVAVIAKEGSPEVARLVPRRQLS